jgi:hypothetical protein
MANSLDTVIDYTQIPIVQVQSEDYIYSLLAKLIYQNCNPSEIKQTPLIDTTKISYDFLKSLWLLLQGYNGKFMSRTQEDVNIIKNVLNIDITVIELDNYDKFDWYASFKASLIPNVTTTWNQEEINFFLSIPKDGWTSNFTKEDLYLYQYVGAGVNETLENSDAWLNNIYTSEQAGDYFILYYSKEFDSFFINKILKSQFLVDVDKSNVCRTDLNEYSLFEGNYGNSPILLDTIKYVEVDLEKENIVDGSLNALIELNMGFT